MEPGLVLVVDGGGGMNLMSGGDRPPPPVVVATSPRFSAIPHHAPPVKNSNQIVDIRDGKLLRSLALVSATAYKIIIYVFYECYSECTSFNVPVYVNQHSRNFLT